MTEIRQRRNLVRSLYYALSTFAPKDLLKYLDRSLKYAGVPGEVELWTGSVTLLAILTGIAGFLFATIMLKMKVEATLIAFDAALVFFVFFAAYMHLYLKMSDRRKRIEEALPDALRMMASNLRAGMPPIIALRMAARPEFGPLEEEIKYAATKSLGTESFTDVLTEMSDRTNSEIFRRIVTLLIASLKAGGRLADLLDNTSDDLIESQQLKSELAVNTRMFAIFILFTVMVGTPLLLSVSIHFVKIVSSVQQKNFREGGGALVSQAGIGGGLVSTPFTVEFILGISYWIIAVTGVLVSVLVGVMSEGKYLAGMKYAPVIITVSLAIFIVLKDYLLPPLLTVPS